MAAPHTLPPIHGAQSHGNMMSGMSGSMKQHPQPVHFAPAPPKGPPSGRLKPIKKITKLTDRELAFQQNFATQQPTLTKRQTTSYRNTYKHNICVEMLHDGFHKSFCELFALIKRQEDERSDAGQESLMWSMTLLKDEHEKLDTLKIHLTRAETALRKGDHEEVYRSRFELARYFQSSGDKWLADHFYDTCLTTAMLVINDGGKMQAESYCNVALSQEENGEYYDAAEKFEAYYTVARTNKDWITADDITYYTDACINLSRIYTFIGDQSEEESLEVMLEYLTKAYEKAKESQIQKLEGEAAYRLGLACDQSGDGDTALVHLNSYLRICRSSGDNDGIGLACDAIAKTFAREGRVEESIEYLKQFVDVAEKSGHEQAYSIACHNLGNIYNTLGNYDEATKYFDKAYNLSRSMGETMSINVNRVQFGISIAHKMLDGFGGHVVLNQLPTVERLIDWKSSRIDDFEKPVPVPSAEPATTRTPSPSKEETATQEESEQNVQATEQGDDNETTTSIMESETAETTSEN